jgi:predicted AAA+ superfamily ATPase
MSFERPILSVLQRRLSEPRRFIQVLAGPRQTGKTTLARQAMSTLPVRSQYGSADEPTLQDRAWIAEQWELGRRKARSAGEPGAVLVLDEIHKVTGWSETVKRLWDEDTAEATPLRVVLLGSSPWLMHRGLGESLAGRFELIRVMHWSYPEMRDAFGWSLEQFLYFGGYPGAAPLIGDPGRWARYINDSLVETTLSRDILLLTRVDKPALLRRLFQLSCNYSGQVLSYQKMLGQLQDAGNTTTLAHYLELLSGAGMLTGLQKFSGQAVRQRASSPKLQVLNNALMTAQGLVSFGEAQQDRDFWGRLLESAAGAHLVNGAAASDCEVCYWRDRSREVDFVLRRGDSVVAVEVKSSRRRGMLPGMEAFCRAYGAARRLLVGGQGMPIEEFFQTPVPGLLG